MQLLLFLCTLLLMCCLTWNQLTLSTVRPLTQSEQFMLARFNALNGRNVATSAFVLQNGVANENDSTYITFQTQQVNLNAIVFPAFGAFQARFPGLYYLYYSVTGNGTEGVTVALLKDSTLLATAVSRNGQPVSKMVLTYMNPSETAFLQVESGNLTADPVNTVNTVDNSYSGVQIAGAIGLSAPSTNFLQQQDLLSGRKRK